MVKLWPSGLAEVSRTVTIGRMDALLTDILSWLVFPGGCIAFVALLVGPTVWRMSRPAPSDDLAAINRFAANRDQRLVEVRKLWFGPWRMREGLPREAGRPYRVCVLDSDGSRYAHTVTADRRDGLGNMELKQRLDGVWMPVLQ